MQPSQRCICCRKKKEALHNNNHRRLATETITVLRDNRSGSNRKQRDTKEKKKTETKGLATGFRRARYLTCNMPLMLLPITAVHKVHYC